MVIRSTASMETLSFTRNRLVEALRHSHSLSSCLESSSATLEKLHTDLHASSQRLRLLHHRTSTLSAVCLHAELAVGPASAVLTAHSSVLLHHRSLLDVDPAIDLSGFLFGVRRLEQALGFLTKNCALAIGWLNDVVALLDEEDGVCVLKVKRSLRILEELNALEAQARLPGGMLFLAMDKLEIELARIFNFTNIPDSDSNTMRLEGLEAIVERLGSNGRGESVGRIYVEVRVAAMRSRISGGGVESDHLQEETEEISCIARWVKGVEFVVKQVVRFEHDACKTISEIPSTVSMDCYGKIIAQSGFLDLLRFGNKVVATAKKEPIKLLKLLEMFAALDGLRLDFNRLFGGRECVQVRDETRDFIREVVEGACEIFNELAVQVLEYSTSCNRAPLEDSDAGVPRLVTFVTDYCHLLLDDKYMPILVQVMSIHRIWHHKDDVELTGIRAIREDLCKILGALEINLDKWSKSSKDPALACFFLMNNYGYLHAGLKDTKLGDLLGEEWLGGYSDKTEYYAAEYLQQSWGRLSSILTNNESEDDVQLSVKRRLREFNDAFDYLWERQSRWALYDQRLRENACRLILQAVLPSYKAYLHDYAFSPACRNYVEYSTVCLESLIASMFQPNAQRTKASKQTRLRKITRIASVGRIQFPPPQFRHDDRMMY